MRNVDGEADHIVAVLSQTELQQVGGAARDLDLIDPARVLVEGLAVVSVCGQGDGAGMRYRHRNCAQPNGLAYTELIGQQPDRGDETLPLQIWLEPG